MSGREDIPTRNPVERTINEYGEWVYQYFNQFDDSGSWLQAHITDPSTIDLDYQLENRNETEYLMYVPTSSYVGFNDVVYVDTGVGRWLPFLTDNRQFQRLQSKGGLVRWALLANPETGDTTYPPSGSTWETGPYGGQGPRREYPIDNPVILPESFEWHTDETRWPDYYSGNMNTGRFLVYESERARDGRYALDIPFGGRFMFDTDTNDTMKRGNYYSFDTYQFLIGTSEVARPRFYFGMQLGQGLDAETYILEWRYDGPSKLFYRPHEGPEVELAETTGTPLKADRPYVVVIRWDDGTLGGTDGDIEVNFFQRFSGEKVSSMKANNPRIEQGTIGWGTPPGGIEDPLGVGDADPMPVGAQVDYLRERKWEPHPDVGTLMDSWEDGDMSEYISGDGFEAVEDWRATDGDYVMKIPNSLQYLTRDADMTTSSGYYYIYDLFFTGDPSNPSNSNVVRFYLSLQLGDVVNSPQTWVDVGPYGVGAVAHATQPDTLYKLADLDITGPQFPLEEWVTVQIRWDDGTLGGYPGDIWAEVYSRKSGDLLVSFGGNAYTLPERPIPGTFGIDSDAYSADTVKTVLMDNLRKSTEPEYGPPVDKPPREADPVTLPESFEGI